MKLLFDQNLSFKLVASLADLFPGSTHVGSAGLSRSPDAEIWSFAAARDFMNVSKDDDFRQLSMLRGAPPKVVWLQVGNCATSQIEQLLRRRYPAIESFSRSAESTFLIVRVDAVEQANAGGRALDEPVSNCAALDPPRYVLRMGQLVPTGADLCTLVEIL